jgi:hypothetical protein
MPRGITNFGSGGTDFFAESLMCGVLPAARSRLHGGLIGWTMFANNEA